MATGDTALDLQANASATDMVNTVAGLELTLQGKLEIVNNCLCRDASDCSCM